MKKTLLIGAAVAVGFSAFAQNQRQAANLNNKTLNRGVHKKDAEVRFPVVGSKKLTGPTQVSSVCSPKAFTSGPNAFGVGGGVTTFQQSCLTYNKDLNVYVWTHRRSNEWAAQNTMSSGSIQTTWKNMNTGAWDSTIIYYEASAVNPGRYPGGVIYNPSGNTNIANAWAVGTGADLVGGGGFTGTWYSARQLTGTSADQAMPGTDLNFVSAPAQPFGNTTFMNIDIQQVGTKVMVTGELADTSTASNANNNTTKGTVIGKATFTGSGAPTWSHDSIVPGFYFNRNGAGNGYASQFGDGARMAFDPTGQIGYVVFMGRLATNYGNSADSSMSPIVYKTTNGGTTWAPVLLGYDWSAKHPELLKNVGELRTTKPKHFQPYLNHGIDVAVDGNGTLHLVTTMTDPYKDGASADSLVFNYTYNYDYHVYHPIMWDLMTDGSCWKTMMIDSVMTSYVSDDPANDTTAAYSGIANGTTFLPYGARLQVSRSTDGSKIFYSWAASDSSITGTVFNSQPDLFMKVYDVNGAVNKQLTPSMNVTNGIGTCFFHVMADQAYFDNTQGKWVCPMVYTLPRSTVSAGVYDGTDVSDHIWVNCGSVGLSDFTMNATINAGTTTGACLVSVKSNNSFVSSVNNYPNPFNGTTNIVVNLNEGKAINLDVFDAIGNLVYSKKVNGNIGENTIVFDGSSFNAGVYYYSVTAGFDKVTKKMIIQK